ncbi:hypothetical protein AB0L53_15955 [Nonomuraea sp. NPDC052129]|uniref:hypothetical protein n=1 Tax=Nonomuraea sp. NPDC052129 TaxID=3154651 RepID=UPI00341DF230
MAAVRPGQVYGNNGVSQPTQSVSVFCNGKMYPDGEPPPNLVPPSNSGQGMRQDYKPMEQEPPMTKTGTISDTTGRFVRYFDQSGLDDFFGGLF